MILGTSSGAGKSLICTAICRFLHREGEIPIPFKGQNMSNNAWIDKEGGEMAYSQVVQAWAAGLEPTCEMNPVLLKPKGNEKSEVIHLGKSVGISNAETYYDEWFEAGWSAIQKGLIKLKASYPRGRIILEGAGSPVEVNLKHRDLTNMRLAKFLDANCILVADIERGGVFAQLIGTLSLLDTNERQLIKGIIINRFRGNRSLFKSGKDWIEKETGISVLGVMPWLDDIFPPEDSLDLLERKNNKPFKEIEIAIIKLPYISNFSDIDPLEEEKTVRIKWIKPGDPLGLPDAIIIPGSKQTLSDLNVLKESGLANEIKNFCSNGGEVFAICGGMQMIGYNLEDPHYLENYNKSKDFEILKGLEFLPINTIFTKDKKKSQWEGITTWPEEIKVSGFELHHGVSVPLNDQDENIIPLFKNSSLGWVLKRKGFGSIIGCYIHGIFDNGSWRRKWLNKIRERKYLEPLATNIKDSDESRQKLFNKLTDEFSNHINLKRIL